MKFFYSLLLLLISLPLYSQRSRVRAVKREKQVQQVVETAAQKLYKSMLSSTAKVMFIDSVVVDKATFLSHIPLLKDAGKLYSYNEYYNVSDEPLGSVYLNGFSNLRYSATGDSTGLKTGIYVSDKLGKTWSEPQRLTELGEEYSSQTYPFLMSDGVTLFFSAKGEKSIGGYDIFFTKRGVDEGRFYIPENYGLPFNSTANDYLLAIDDINEVGYLVSDRYQNEDKVCIYTFIPANGRESINGVQGAELESFAKLNSIRDTWAFGDREAQLARISKLMTKGNKQKEEKVFFVIDDNRVYRKMSDFKSIKSRNMYVQLRGLLDEQEKLAVELEALRDAYHKGNKSLTQKILSMEAKTESLSQNIVLMEKDIRRLEF